MDGKILLGALMPHPPLIIPDIGGEETAMVRDTADAMLRAAQDLVQASPDVVVVISPHGPMFEDAVTIMGGDVLQGDLAEFQSDVTFSYQSDVELAAEIVKTAEDRDVSLYLMDDSLKAEFGIASEVDYGAGVPLYFLEKAGYTGPIVLLCPGGVSAEMLYRAGMCVQTAVQNLGRRAVVLASGDNSHALAQDAPMGFREEGVEFDAALQECLRDSDLARLLTLDESMLEAAAEDTVGSMTVLCGAFDRVPLASQLLSYEGPFGVGYTVATVTPKGGDGVSLLPNIIESRAERLEEIRASETPFVRLAREALETYVKEEKVIAPPTLMPEEMKRTGGCFVSIKQLGRLRGCIGTVDAVTPTLAEEIIRNAIEAGIADDRFFPVEENELDELIYKVDVLEPEKPVTDTSELNPRIYGLIVQKGDRSAVLLPDLEGVNTVEEQLMYAKEKAGIAQDEEGVELFRFRVTRYT
ncbi:AmmeMemoRadiSam system protein A [Tumebacillus avium]|uniref:AmmeMemoRadiSam system protein A n=1 Tax=Tumebacillus avium TaxID=1903704 RepID=A0A1Y0INV0_9BACL|nr:AmmeMemoRadiSam system protein A [Tumebacillus avium]ARU61506.1 AmmeMemoRadiSam system protein A [Tumebacillus avium]